MIWQFTLVDSINAEFAIQEPVGWDEITWTAEGILPIMVYSLTSIQVV